MVQINYLASISTILFLVLSMKLLGSLDSSLKSVGLTITEPNSGSIESRFLTQADLIAKLMFCGIAPVISKTFLASSVATVMPITSPFSLNRGPPLLPGCIGTEI